MPDAGATTRFAKRTVRDLEIDEGERVLARVDFNVPLEGGEVTDDARIRAALPTIELLLEKRARLILCSHLARPKGRDPETSLAPVSARLGELIDAPVHQAPEVRGEHHRCAAIERAPQRRHHRAQARIVRDRAALERGVEVGADEDALARQRQLRDGQLGHYKVLPMNLIRSRTRDE